MSELFDYGASLIPHIRFLLHFAGFDEQTGFECHLSFLQTKRQAKRELETIRAKIVQQQDEEKKKLDAEMDRLALLKEQHDQNVASKEQEIQKMKDELMKKWEEEKKEVEKQREQIEVLRKEIEEKEEAVKRASSPERRSDGSSSTSLATSDESNGASPEIRLVRFVAFLPGFPAIIADQTCSAHTCTNIVTYLNTVALATFIQTMHKSNIQTYNIHIKQTNYLHI